jgi:flavin-dependent dehydrogenase
MKYTFSTQLDHLWVYLYCYLKSVNKMTETNSRFNEYDAIIIGGGPSGLTAAYFLAKAGYDTVLFERLPKQGMLDHPCGAMVSPVDDYITFEQKDEGIYFNEVEFLFPNDMIIASPGKMEFKTPNGSAFGMNIDNPQEHLIFQINKQELLHSLAQRAENAGAELIYGTTVSKLVIKDDVIKGVHVGDKIIKAPLVLSGEGLSRRLTQQANLYDTDPEGYIMIYSLYVKNVDLSREQLGQFGYFGGKASPVPQSSVTFHSLGHNRALILISVLLDEYKWPHEAPIKQYLNHTIDKIPLLKDITDEGKLYKKNACWIKLQTPSRLVRDGVIGMGDSVAPLGHSSNAIAMLMGQEAAQLAIKAHSHKNYSSSMLESYDEWLESELFQGVKFEGHLISTLLGFSDEQLNTIGNVLKGANLRPFFIGSKWDRLKASMKLLFNWNAIKNWTLVRKLLG